MSTITIKHVGTFGKIQRWFRDLRKAAALKRLNEYGELGVSALRAATPVDTGKTASCWTYEISQSSGTTEISWINTNTNRGVNVAVILQYGHGTGTGGYVQGRDYINPAMQPVFDMIAQEAWKEVTSV